MTNKKRLVTLSLLTAALVMPTGALACDSAYGGSYGGSYGGGEDLVKEIDVDKSVSRPRVNNEGDLIFEDNLSSSEEVRYRKDQEVVFELRVKNVGEETFAEVTVIDRFPDYVDFVRGEGGTWNADSREYRYTITDLTPGEEDIHLVTGRINTEASVCLVNNVTAEGDGKSDSDNASFCTGERVLGVAGMPETGVSPLFPLAALAFAGAGVVLRKKQ